MVPWLITFAGFTIFRLVAFLFFSILNDLIFAYNIIMCLLWSIFTLANIYGWLLVYSLYIELTDLTKLEDLAHLRVSSMSALIIKFIKNLSCTYCVSAIILSHFHISKDTVAYK